MAIKAVIFDCFGVLTADGWLTFRSRTFADKPELMAKAKALNMQADQGRVSYDYFVSEIAKMAEVEKNVVLAALEITSANEELFEYIKDNIKGQYRLGFLSNAAKNWMSDLFEPWQVDLFEEVVISYQVGFSKPDAEIYELTLSRLGVLPGEAVLIDDQPSYCEGAEKLGIKTVLFKNTGQAIRDLKKVLLDNA